MQIELKLNLDEVNAVLDALGQLPTSSNVWPLAAKVRAQASTQISKQEPGSAVERSEPN